MLRMYVVNVFGILVTAIVNVINHVTGQYLDYENCKCRRKLFDKLVEEFSENMILMKMK